MRGPAGNRFAYVEEMIQLYPTMPYWYHLMEKFDTLDFTINVLKKYECVILAVECSCTTKDLRALDHKHLIIGSKHQQATLSKGLQRALKECTYLVGYTRNGCSLKKIKDLKHFICSILYLMGGKGQKGHDHVDRNMPVNEPQKKLITAMVKQAHPDLAQQFNREAKDWYEKMLIRREKRLLANAEYFDM